MWHFSESGTTIRCEQKVQGISDEANKKEKQRRETEIQNIYKGMTIKKMEV